MTVERTLSIIKPDGVEKNLIGEIYRRFERAGLEVIAAKMLHLSRAQRAAAVRAAGAFELDALLDALIAETAG